MPVEPPRHSACCTGECVQQQYQALLCSVEGCKRVDVLHASCRLFTLVPTQQEVKDLLDHVDSAYIRAVRIQSSMADQQK